MQRVKLVGQNDRDLEVIAEEILFPDAERLTLLERRKVERLVVELKARRSISFDLIFGDVVRAPQHCICHECGKSYKFTSYARMIRHFHAHQRAKK